MTSKKVPTSSLGLAAAEINMTAYPNPANTRTNTIKYSVDVPSQLRILLYDIQGRPLKTLVEDREHEAGVFYVQWDTDNLPRGTYVVTAIKNGSVKQTIKVIKN